MKAKKVEAAETSATKIPILKLEKAWVKVRGVEGSFMLMHKWSEKAIEKMAEKQGGKAREKKTPKVPTDECEAATYRMKDGKFGVPAIWFKAAMVAACRYVEGMPMTVAKGAFFVMGDLLPLTKHSDPLMRRDMVRLESGVADIRYRPQFDEWECTLPIHYNPTKNSLAQILFLLQNAGFHVGVGDMRAGQSGRPVGQFELVEA